MANSANMKHVREENTVVIFGRLAGLDERKINHMFASRGFVRVSPNSARATIVWSSQNANYKFDQRSFRIRSRVKNLLDMTRHEVTTNKGLLHKLMAEQFPRTYCRHFARTWPLLDFDLIMDRPYIVRPTTVGYFGGKGIARISTREELQEQINKFKREGIAESVIVSEYIDDPCLYDGRKFHLRMYFLVCLGAPGRKLTWSLFGHDKTRDELFPCAKILTAAQPYQHAHYEDPAIHDTHAKSTPGALFFPTHTAHITNINGAPLSNFAPNVYEQVANICGVLAEILRPHARTYAESAYGFEVFGLDVLLAGADPRAILLEVNDRVGYDTPADPLFDLMQDAYFEWVWTNGIAPCLK